MCLSHFSLVHLKYDNKCPAEKKMSWTLEHNRKTTQDSFNTCWTGDNTLTEFPPGGQLDVPMGYFLLEIQDFKFTAFVSVVQFVTGPSLWGQEGRKEGLNDPKLTSGHYGTLGKTGSRNWGFDTNVWYFSYNAPCDAWTFITIAN